MASNLPPFSKASTFSRTQPPNPEWECGEGIQQSAFGREWMVGEKNGWKVVDTGKEDKTYVYRLMTSGIIPRPVAFVSSIAADGTPNLAPFSWFNMVTHDPPTISISARRESPGRGKDTTENIKATKTFTVNIINEPWIEQANFCSLDSPPDVSEWPASGLTMECSTLIKPARVKESAFSMECEVFQMHDICHPGSAEPTTTLILGLVKVIHVRKDVLNEREVVDPRKFRVISRLGGVTFGRIGESFDLPRPRWEDEHEKVEKMILT